MDAETARALVEQISYKPTWRFTVDSVEGTTLYLKLEYHVPNSDKGYASRNPEQHYWLTGDVATFWPIDLESVSTADEFQMVVTNAVMQVELHEMREFLSFTDDFFKPLHPHTLGGQINWAGLVTGGNPSEMSASIRNDESYGQKQRTDSVAAMIEAELDSLFRGLE